MVVVFWIGRKPISGLQSRLVFDHKFGDGVRDARTTKLPRRESATLAARIADKSVSAQCAPSARQRKGPEMSGQPSLPPRAKSELGQYPKAWRREWDSNPRYGFP